jgi:hypothetical protein
MGDYLHIINHHVIQPSLPTLLKERGLILHVGGIGLGTVYSLCSIISSLNHKAGFCSPVHHNLLFFLRGHEGIDFSVWFGRQTK